MRRWIICMLAAMQLLLVFPYASTAAEPDQPPRPGEVIAKDSWLLVMLPDTQSYVDHAENYPILLTMMDWIADNQDRLNIELVVQVGDLVFQNGIPVGSMGTGNQNSDEQWTNIRRAFARLDGVLPYVVVPGNHDYGICDAESRTTQFDNYFLPDDNPCNDPERGGILAGLGPNAAGKATLENAYYEFEAPDGREFLIIGLEWGPRQAAVNWARGIAAREEYNGFTKALVTHAYMYHDDTRLDWNRFGKAQSANPHVYTGTKADTNDGGELWSKLVNQVPGFELVFSGHIGGDMVGFQSAESQFGQEVHQMLFNAQFLPNGGNGWLRLLEFKADGRTVVVHTFSPWFADDDDPATDPWRPGADDNFSFELTPLETAGNGK